MCLGISSILFVLSVNEDQILETEEAQSGRCYFLTPLYETAPSIIFKLRKSVEYGQSFEMDLYKRG